MNYQTDQTKLEIENRFGPYRKPTESTIPKFEAIREKVLELALLIDQLCPESKEKNIAISQLVFVKMSANAAIALYEIEKG